MKTKSILLGAAVLASLSLVSCESASRLAKEVDGTWTGGVDRIPGEALNSDLFSTYTFEYDDSAKTPGGNIVINSTLSTNYSDNVVIGTEPSTVEMTLAGTSTVTGTWTAVDDDEIIITLNPSSLEVKIDPDAQTITTTLPDASTEAIDTLKPQLVSLIKDRLAYDLRIKYSSPIHMDDIKVLNGKTLNYEINDIDYTLTAE